MLRIQPADFSRIVASPGPPRLSQSPCDRQDTGEPEPADHAVQMAACALPPTEPSGRRPAPCMLSARHPRGRGQVQAGLTTACPALQAQPELATLSSLALSGALTLHQQQLGGAEQFNQAFAAHALGAKPATVGPSPPCSAAGSRTPQAPAGPALGDIARRSAGWARHRGVQASPTRQEILDGVQSYRLSFAGESRVHSQRWGASAPARS